MALLEDSVDAIPVSVADHGGARILVVGDRVHFADIKTHVNDLITQAWSRSVSTIAIPIDCLPEEFFQLRSGIAVSISQKLVNYRITIAFVGNIADKLLDSQPLGDFIRDCNRGRWIWFVDDMRELATRLASRIP
jgi:hypothetical protein